MKPLKEFVRQRLPDILQKIERDDIGASVTELNIYEKALIYYYSIDGYEQLNEDLRDGKPNEYEVYLNEALDKLPDYDGESFRGAALTNAEILRYKNAIESDEIIVYPAFLSSSKSLGVARAYSRGSTVFTIASKTGKNIEEISFYGTRSPQNEKEILYRSKIKFSVISIDQTTHITLITLEEV